MHYLHRSQAARDDLQGKTKQLPCEITEVCTTTSEVRCYREVCKGNRSTHHRCHQPAPPEGEFPRLDIHQITKNLPASPIKLQQIRNETANDSALSKLRPKALQNCWNFREELTIEDGPSRSKSE